MFHDPLSQFCRGQASLCSILARFCSLPNSMRSEEEALRWKHEDLPDLSRASAIQELEALNLLLRLEPSTHPWFFERRERLRGLVGHGG
jgi:hypothetical protein